MYKSENHILNFVMVIASVWIVNKFWQCFYEKKKLHFYLLLYGFFIVLYKYFFSITEEILI